MKNNKKTVQGKVITKPLNDGMNTPVPDKAVAKVSPASEVALFKQARNTLGDPNKI